MVLKATARLCPLQLRPCLPAIPGIKYSRKENCARNGIAQERNSIGVALQKTCKRKRTVKTSTTKPHKKVAQQPKAKGSAHRSAQYLGQLTIIHKEANNGDRQYKRIVYKLPAIKARIKTGVIPVKQLHHHIAGQHGKQRKGKGEALLTDNTSGKECHGQLRRTQPLGAGCIAYYTIEGSNNKQ